MIGKIGAAIVGAVLLGGCSSGGMTRPDADSVIAIRASQGAQAFNPNPLQLSSGTFSWKNNDGVTHHLVFDDGSIDAGDLAPGATSPAFAVRPGSYHCTIHPTMVGSVNAAVPPEPAPGTY